jgi:hypothetical protein
MILRIVASPERGEFTASFFRMEGKSRRSGEAGVLRALGSQAVQGTSVDRQCEGNRGVWEGGRSSAENSGGGVVEFSEGPRGVRLR